MGTKYNLMQSQDGTAEDKAKAEKLIVEAWDEVNLGHYDAAVETAMEALSLDPDDWYINTCLGVFFRQQGKLAKSERYCVRAVELNSENSRVWENLGITYFHQQRFSEAAEQFAKAVELEECPGTYTLMASAKISLGDLEGAIRDSERALELDPDWDEAEGMLEEARELLEPQNQDETEEVEKLIRQAWDEHHLDRDDAAAEKAMEALTLDPNGWYINAILAEFFREQGKLEEAEKHGARAVELNPELFLLHQQLATTYVHQERFSEAVEQFTESVELRETARAYTMMASAKISLGDREGAIRDAERAVELDPDWDEAEDMLQEARELLNER